MRTRAFAALVAGLSAAAQAQINLEAKPAVTDADIWRPNTPFLPDLTPGYALIEGDIQVPLAQYLAIVNGADSTFGAATYWPSGIVPYDFVTSGTGAVSAANQSAAVAAMNAIASRAGLTFRPATGSDANRVRFQNSAFNNSPVGMQGGTQIINIFNWNFQIIICHELYHSLGFWHEQSRSDRGAFVSINPGNICGASGSPGDPCNPNVCQMCSNGTTFVSCAGNFNIIAGSSFYGFYDFDSFMHYDRSAFTCNGLDTIQVLAPYTAQWQSAIGQRDHFSYYDAITCRGLYPFNTDRWIDQGNTGTQGGTFLLPWNLPFVSAVAAMPTGGTLFVKYGGSYSAVGTYANPVTIDAPAGAVTLGN